MDRRISVIIPVYNVEQYLEDCLESIINQSFTDYEIICVDDGSTDQSPCILQEYQSKIDNMVVIHQENQGLSGARNTGIKNATGRYICFVDSDDMLTEDALQKMWDAVECDFPDILTYETAPLLYEEEWLEKRENKDAYYRVMGDYIGIRTGREFFVELIENDDFVESAWLMLIRLEWLKEQQILFCLGALYEDSLFAIQSYFACKRMKHIKERLYIYRIRRNSIMTEKFALKHLYYRIWQFNECLKAIFLYAENEREINALSKYAEQVMANIKHINYSLDDDEREKVSNWESLYRLIAKMMGIGSIGLSCNRELSTEGLLRVINKHSKIILYGAGLIGNKVKRYLEYNKLGEKIIGFAVSKQQEDALVKKLPIKCICNYQPEEGLLLIVSARENYHKDMVMAARTQGFSDILVIDYSMEWVIDKELAKYEGDIYET